MSCIMRLADWCWITLNPTPGEKRCWTWKLLLISHQGTCPVAGPVAPPRDPSSHCRSVLCRSDRFSLTLKDIRSSGDRIVPALSMEAG